MRQHAGWLVAAAAICALFAGSALSGPTTPAAVNGGVYNSTPPTLSDQQTGVFQLDANGQLKVAATATLTNPTIGAAVPATGNYVAGNQGGLLTGLTLDGSSNLNVNCAAGCSGGTFNNNADNVATSSTNGQAAAWLYGWDGAAWDRVPATSTDGMLVNLGSNNDVTVTGTVTAVSGTAANFKAEVVGTGTFVTQSAITAAAASIADGAIVTLGAKADAKSTATDTTAITIMQVLKEISAMEQAPASRAVTNTGTFATQSAITAASGSFSSGALASGSVASGAFASGALASGSVASGAFASGSIADGANVTLGAKADAKSTATDTTAITIMQVLKEISAMAQAPAALPANQSTNVAQINGVTPLMGNGTTGTGSPRVTIASDNTTLTNTFGNVGNVPITSGGQTFTTLTLAASTNATNVKASAGQLYTVSGFNMSSATPIWVSLYNNSGTPTCGTGIVAQFMIPGSTTGAGFVYNVAPGMAFSTGIAFCATTGIAGTGNAAASTYVVNFGYK